MPDKGPELGEYRAIRETNTITGKERWVVCKWVRAQEIKVGGTIKYSDPYWAVARAERFSTLAEAEELVAEFASEHAWVRRLNHDRSCVRDA